MSHQAGDGGWQMPQIGVLAPAAALILCLVANRDERGLSGPEALFGLHFAFDMPEAGQIADADFAAVIDARRLSINRAAR
jgi:hypothetical protein